MDMADFVVFFRAFSIGKPVPPEVLADYPDLSCPGEQAPEQEMTKDPYR